MVRPCPPPPTIIASYSFFGSGDLQAGCQFSWYERAFLIKEKTEYFFGFFRFFRFCRKVSACRLPWLVWILADCLCWLARWDERLGWRAGMTRWTDAQESFAESLICSRSPLENPLEECLGNPEQDLLEESLRELFIGFLEEPLRELFIGSLNRVP